MSPFLSFFTFAKTRQATDVCHFKKLVIIYTSLESPRLETYLKNLAFIYFTGTSRATARGNSGRWWFWFRYGLLEDKEKKEEEERSRRISSWRRTKGDWGQREWYVLIRNEFCQYVFASSCLCYSLFVNMLHWIWAKCRVW